MSISDWHPELWNPAWSVGAIIIGLISFMLTDEHTTGSIRASEVSKKRIAINSKNELSGNEIFQELFKPFFPNIGFEDANGPAEIADEFL